MFKIPIYHNTIMSSHIRTQTGKTRDDETKKILHLPLSSSRTLELKEKHRAGGQGALNARESRELLLGGNVAHQEKVVASGTTPKARYNKIVAKEADYLVVACSDARNQTLDSEEDADKLVGLQIRVAGNVIPKSGVSRDEIKEAAEGLREGGLVLITAHINCGAVAEHVKWEHGGCCDTGSGPLNKLLEAVKGENPKENALAQLEHLKTIVGDDKSVAAVLYDWEAGTYEILTPEPSELVEILTSKWEMAHKRADDGTLGERLSATQKPHAIVIGSNDMPFSVDTVFDSEQNAIFSTTGSSGGLDNYDEASILYAVEHLGVQHIAFVAPENDSNSAMFDKWEADIRSMGAVAEKLDSGALKITRFGYDLSNGACKDTQMAA